MQQFTLEDFCSPNDRDSAIKNICKDSSIDIVISYESDFRNAKVLRELTDDICREFSVSPKWRTRIVLIIDELNNNAIEYGSRHGDINTLNIQVERENTGSIHIKAYVTDTGTGDHAKAAEDMEELRREHESKDFQKHHSIRGRGLFLIISKLVDSLDFSNASTGGLIVQVEKSLQENSEK